MPIILNLDVMLARRKTPLSDLKEKVDITLLNLSILKTGKAKAVRFSTLEAICEALDCQPGDILAFISEKNHNMSATEVYIVASTRQMQGFTVYQKLKPLV